MKGPQLAWNPVSQPETAALVDQLAESKWTPERGSFAFFSSDWLLGWSVIKAADNVCLKYALM